MARRKGHDKSLSMDRYEIKIKRWLEYDKITDPEKKALVDMMIKSFNRKAGTYFDIRQSAVRFLRSRGVHGSIIVSYLQVIQKAYKLLISGASPNYVAQIILDMCKERGISSDLVAEFLAIGTLPAVA